MMSSLTLGFIVLMIDGILMENGKQIHLSEYDSSKGIYHTESTKIAFSVARTTPMSTTSTNAATVTFDKIILNDGFGFDNHSSHFYAPLPGNYIFMFSTRSISSVKKAEIVLYHNGDATVKAYARTGYYPGSNQIVLTLEIGDSIWLDLQPDRTADSNALHLTSFSGHLIQEDNNHELVTAFTAVKTVPLVNGGSVTTITFDQVITNTGQAFQSNSHFVAPADGNYIFMVSITGYDESTSYYTVVNLVLQGKTQITPATYYTNTACMRVVLSLKASERVWVDIWPNGRIKDATFAGYFLHNNVTDKIAPRHLSPNPVSFGVGRQAYFKSDQTPITIIFDTLFTNVGLGFDITSSHFHAPVDGVYVFMFNAQSHPIPYIIHLKHNGKVVFGTTSETNYQLSANQVILSLSAFDNVWMELQPNGGMDHDSNRLYHTFSGYLLY